MSICNAVPADARHQHRVRLIRNPEGGAKTRMAVHGEVGICVSIIAAAEPRYGAARKGSARLTAQMKNVLDKMTIVAFEPPCDVEYGRIRAELESAGTPIGPVDLFVAAHAVSLGVALATHNVSKFSRVRGLRVENWLE